MPHSDTITKLAHSATLDDISFTIVLNAWRRTKPSADAPFDDLLAFVGELLDAGFEPVTSPYTMPQSQPWPEKDRPAIFARITHEWVALTEDPTFLDICWFHLPKARHPAPD